MNEWNDGTAEDDLDFGEIVLILAAIGLLIAIVWASDLAAGFRHRTSAIAGAFRGRNRAGLPEDDAGTPS